MTSRRGFVRGARLLTIGILLGSSTMIVSLSVCLSFYCSQSLSVLGKTTSDRVSQDRFDSPVQPQPIIIHPPPGMIYQPAVLVPEVPVLFRGEATPPTVDIIIPPVSPATRHQPIGTSRMDVSPRRPSMQLVMDSESLSLSFYTIRD